MVYFCLGLLLALVVAMGFALVGRRNDLSRAYRLARSQAATLRSMMKAIRSMARQEAEHGVSCSLPDGQAGRLPKDAVEVEFLCQQCECPSAIRGLMSRPVAEIGQRANRLIILDKETA